MTRKSSGVCAPQVSPAELVLCSEEPMKSRPAAFASATRPAWVWLPSEWTVWVCRSPRYQPAPVPATCRGAMFGTNAGPSGAPYSRVTVTVQETPGGTMATGPRMTRQVPGSIGPAM